MNQKHYRFLFGLFVIVAITLVSSYLTTVGHEKAHYQINKYFGVESHSVVYGFGLLGGETIQDSDFLTIQDKKDAMLANGINEAIGYQLQPLILTIIILLTAILLTLMETMARK